MCLYVDREATKSFKKNNRAKEITVYKVVSIRQYSSKKVKVETPFYDAPIEFNSELRAKGYLHPGWAFIEQGAIHVYTSLKKAKEKSVPFESRFILKCKAKAEDFIAKGENGDAAYKAIQIPPSVDCICTQPTGEYQQETLKKYLADCGHQAAI